MTSKNDQERLTHELVGEAFEVFGLGNHRDDGMIRRLGVGRDAAENLSGVESSREDSVLEQVCVHVMRAAKSGERAARFENFEGAEVDFFVSTQGVRHGCAVTREGWRIEDDEVPAGDDFFVRFRDSLGFEPIKNISGFERAFFRKAVRGGITRCSGNGVGTLIQEMDLGCAAATRGVEAKAAKEAEAIEDLRAFSEIGDALVVELLIQVQTGLVACEKISLKFQAVQIDGNGTIQFASDDSVGIGKPFELAGGEFVAFDDGARREYRLEGSEDKGFSLVHSQRRSLDYKDIFVFVDNEAAQEIAFSVDDAERGGVREMFLSNSQGRANAYFEKRLIYLDAFRGKDADVDFGSRIVKSDAKQALTVVLYLDEITIGGRLGKTKHGAMINPGVAGDDPIGFARFQNNGGQ